MSYLLKDSTTSCYLSFRGNSSVPPKLLSKFDYDLVEGDEQKEFVIRLRLQATLFGTQEEAEKVAEAINSSCGFDLSPVTFGVKTRWETKPIKKQLAVAA